MWRMGAVAIAAMTAAGGLAQPAANTAQARYDAAQAAYDRRDWQAAADGFATLLPADPAKTLGHSGAVIAARLADAQLNLGRYEAAEATARRALPGLGADTLDQARTWSTIGFVTLRAMRFDEATDAYGKASGIAERNGDGTERVRAALGLTAASMTVTPARAATLLDALLADKPLIASMDKKTLAGIEQMRAEAALNAGDLVMAKRWIDAALRDSGGSVSTRVSQMQIAIRGDAAIVAQKRNDEDEVHRLLAFSGAGHLDSIDWIGAHQGDLPVCDDDVRPNDVAIVQFALTEDGRVTGAVPVYASRPGMVGTTFARALGGWRWTSAALVKVKPFWRSGIRFEMRCETRPAPDRLSDFFAKRIDDWGATHVPIADRPSLRTGNRDDDTQETIAGLRAIFDAHHAPPDAYALLIDKAAELGGSPGMGPAGRGKAIAAGFARSVPAFVKAYPDATASAWLLLEWALAAEQGRDLATARSLLERVLAMSPATLDEDPALRKVATLHLALVRRQQGDAAGARSTLAGSGISAEQCALVDTRPVPLKLSIVSSQFPSEALRWGFEGYVQVAYDIGADGRIAMPRTVLAYPPFVFGPGTERAVMSFRYSTPAIDGKAVGCQGETQTVNYRIPTR